MEKYVILAFIGEGSFGRVFKVKNKDTNDIYALKVIRKKGRSTKDLKSLMQECDIQQHLRHPNIIRMVESINTDTELCVVTEFAQKELHGILRTEGCFTEPKAQLLTWDLVSALYYLHSHRVLHRDLKPQNVLIDAHGKAKLCDFGLARNMTTGTHVLTSIKGTPLYMAPELIDEKPYDHQADLWSLGCIVYEMFTGQPPFSTSSIVQLVSLIRHRPVQWPSHISNDAKTFLMGLLHKDPTLRLSWQEILVHPFVAGHIFILPEQTPTESPFTQPLSRSQTVAKQLQKERLNSAQRLVPQNLQILERREQMKAIRIKQLRMTDAVPVSDDDSIRAVSAISMRDSLKTDDDDIQPITNHNAVFLKHEFNILNEDNLVISNLNTNMAELALQPKPLMLQRENNKIDHDKIEKCIDFHKPPSDNNDSNKLEEQTAEHSEANKRKLSQNLDNFFIRLKSNFKGSKNTHSAGSPMSENDGDIGKDVLLSRSVPPSYKQKLIQFSRDRFGGGNRLTRSLKKSFLIGKSDKERFDKIRRMSEPVELSAYEIQREKGEEKTTGSRENSVEDKPLQESSEDVKCSDPNSNESQDLIDNDSTPIENEEWLAFMRSNMKEVLEGDVESLTQQNIVSMVVGVARNAGAATEVRASLAILLSLPFVTPHVSRQTINTILKVYLDVKLVPNLIYAARLLIRQSASKNNCPESPVSCLTNEEVMAVCRLMELSTQLCMRDTDFVHQLCDAVAVLNISPLFAQFLMHYDKSTRIVSNIISMLIVILQDIPENAELVESVLFEGEYIPICDLLHHPSDTLRVRVCVLFGLLARYCCTTLCGAMEGAWKEKHLNALEKLKEHPNETLSRSALCTIKDLSKLSFYKMCSVKT